MEGDTPLELTEAMRVLFVMIMGGHVTVTRSIPNAITTLLSYPDQLEAVLEDRSLVPAMVDELIRYESPAQGMFRTVQVPTELGGVKIPAGDRVMVHWGSANRDERIFDRPDTFDIRRERVATAHVGFGRGTHACPGKPLARLELQVAIPRLFDRLPDLKVADGHDSAQRDNVFISRGYEKLGIEWNAEKAAAIFAGRA